MYVVPYSHFSNFKDQIQGMSFWNSFKSGYLPTSQPYTESIMTCAIVVNFQCLSRLNNKFCPICCFFSAWVNIEVFAVRPSPHRRNEYSEPKLEKGIYVGMFFFPSPHRKLSAFKLKSLGNSVSFSKLDTFYC